MDTKKLSKKWESEVFKPVSADSIADDTCYRSMCLGWALAQGLTIDEALDFYEKLIPLELF